MPVAAAIVAGGFAYAGAREQSKAAGRAADSQLQATRENIDFQREIFEQQREDLAPWREAGINALTQMEEGVAQGRFDPGAFQFEFNQDDPSYQFRLAEGVRARDRSAAARGRLLSGAQDRAITRYGPDYASTEYQNA
ncbi:MAG: hypothetical protein ACR2RB_15600, partial [Gammaproteobacteria bacterium]